MLHIAVINESTAITSSAVKKMIPAFSSQWNNELNDAWGVGQRTSPFLTRVSHRPRAVGGSFFWMTPLRPMRLRITT